MPEAQGLTDMQMLACCIGWGLNLIAFLAHIRWADPEPTHEDDVQFTLLVLCICPYLPAAIVAYELITQKIFNIHHGVKHRDP